MADEQGMQISELPKPEVIHAEIKRLRRRIAELKTWMDVAAVQHWSRKEEQEEAIPDTEKQCAVIPVGLRAKRGSRREKAST
jgi:hypothetical protein